MQEMIGKWKWDKGRIDRQKEIISEKQKIHNKKMNQIFQTHSDDVAQAAIFKEIYKNMEIRSKEREQERSHVKRIKNDEKHQQEIQKQKDLKVQRDIMQRLDQLEKTMLFMETSVNVTSTETLAKYPDYLSSSEHVL